MSCAAARRHLEAYVDGELSPDAAAAVRAHLTACAACAAEHRAAVTLPGRLAALTGPAAPDLLAAVMAQVQARHGRRRLSATLLAAEAILTCLTLVQLGLDGLLSAAAASLRDGGALLGGNTAAPAAAGLGLVVTLLLLVAVSTAHLGLIGAGARRA